MNTVAVIPARGGSKRIPHKNIRTFCGRPMLAWPIEAARQSGLFKHIIVSTDSEEIADIARQNGAEAPFLRPTELADDHTPTAPVLLHALEWLERQGVEVEHLCCIYATAPFVRPEYIKKGLEILRKHKATSVFSVTTFAFPILRSLKMRPDGRLEMFWPEYELTRSNDLPEAYHDAGQFYWLQAEKFKQNKRLYSSDSRPVVLPRYLVQDIDTPEDWETAERMFQALALERRQDDKGLEKEVV